MRKWSRMLVRAPQSTAACGFSTGSPYIAIEYK